MSDETPATNPNKRKGRKKRKDFLKNAKKYAKKGQKGRGTQISEELYNYFVGILDAMKQGIEDNDERGWLKYISLSLCDHFFHTTPIITATRPKLHRWLSQKL